VALVTRDPVTRDPVILGYLATWLLGYLATWLPGYLATWLPCDPWRPEDPGIRVVGGTAYGHIYMCVHTWYWPMRADVNMARGGGDRELE
jgi:hypothetical protein